MLFRGKEIDQKVKIKRELAKGIMGTNCCNFWLAARLRVIPKLDLCGCMRGAPEARPVIILTVYLVQNGLSTISFKLLGNTAIQYTKVSQISEFRSKLTLLSAMVTIRTTCLKNFDHGIYLCI